MPRRRDVLRRMVAGGAALAVAACHHAPAKVLRVGSQKGGTKALMLGSGALEGVPYRVEWAEFPAAQHLLEALGAGAVDVGMVGDAPYLFGYQTGKPIKAVAARVMRPRAHGALGILVRGGSPMRTPADLKGRRIVTGRGSIGHYLVLRVLEKAGIGVGEVALSFLAPADAAAALASGAVDAWSTWGAYVPTGEAAGQRIVADGHDYVDGAGFDVVHENVLRDKPDLLRDYLAREAAAMRWRLRHSEAYARLLSQETGLPLAIARITAARSAYVDAPITPALVAQQQAILDTFTRGGALVAHRPLAAAYVLGAPA